MLEKYSMSVVITSSGHRWVYVRCGCFLCSFLSLAFQQLRPKSVRAVATRFYLCWLRKSSFKLLNYFHWVSRDTSSTVNKSFEPRSQKKTYVKYLTWADEDLRRATLDFLTREESRTTTAKYVSWGTQPQKLQLLVRFTSCKVHGRREKCGITPRKTSNTSRFTWSRSNTLIFRGHHFRYFAGKLCDPWVITPKSTPLAGFI